MACCHTLTKIEGQLTGDPLDLKMFEATNFIFEEPNVDDTNKFDMLTPTVVRPAELARDAAEADFITKFGAADGPPPPFEVGIIRELPFSSSLQVLRCYYTGRINPEDQRALLVSINNSRKSVET